LVLSQSVSLFQICRQVCLSVMWETQFQQLQLAEKSYRLFKEIVDGLDGQIVENPLFTPEENRSIMGIYSKLYDTKMELKRKRDLALNLFDNAANPIPPRPSSDSLYIQIRDYGPQYRGHYPEHTNEDNKQRNYVTVSQEQIIRALGNGSEAKAVKELKNLLGTEYTTFKAKTMKGFVKEIELDESEMQLGISHQKGLQPIVEKFTENEQNKKFDPNLEGKELG